MVSKVEQTALMTAYARSLTEDPDSVRIFRAARRILQRRYGEQTQDLEVPRLAVSIEARSRAIDALVAQVRSPQILELASGLSPRGVVWAPTIERYVECDLPAMARLKAEAVAQAGLSADNHTICPADVTKRTDLAALAAHLNPDRPVTVIIEGLLWYLTMAEKAQLRTQLAEILYRFGGVIITTDVPPLSQCSPVGKPRDKATANEKDFSGNRFLDRDHFVSFFSAAGLVVTLHEFDDLIDISSLQAALGTPHDAIVQTLRQYGGVATMCLNMQGG